MQASFLLISIHAPRTGSDPCTAIIATFSASFQSTLPARGATCSVSASFVRSSQFQSTLPARGATILVRQLPQLFPISIHAPRTGSDVVHQQRQIFQDISIHAPRTGSDENHRRGRTARPHFNPRSPHGERLPPTCARNLWRNFNPRSPHGERQDRAFLNRRIEISIHAPRTGSDDGRGRKKRSKNLISIHAPRTGSDVVS